MRKCEDQGPKKTPPPQRRLVERPRRRGKKGGRGWKYTVDAKAHIESVYDMIAYLHFLSCMTGGREHTYRKPLSVCTFGFAILTHPPLSKGEFSGVDRRKKVRPRVHLRVNTRAFMWERNAYELRTRAFVCYIHLRI